MPDEPREREEARDHPLVAELKRRLDGAMVPAGWIAVSLTLDKINVALQPVPTPPSEGEPTARADWWNTECPCGCGVRVLDPDYAAKHGDADDPAHSGVRELVEEDARANPTTRADLAKWLDAYASDASNGNSPAFVSDWERQRDVLLLAAQALRDEEAGSQFVCARPIVQAGNDDFCSLPEGHDGNCVAYRPASTESVSPEAGRMRDDQCPTCGGPVVVMGDGTTHWYSRPDDPAPPRVDPEDVG